MLDSIFQATSPPVVLPTLHKFYITTLFLILLSNKTLLGLF